MAKWYSRREKNLLNNYFLYPSVSISIANYVEQNARPTTASEEQLKVFQEKVLNDSPKRIVRKYSDKEKANYISMFDKYKQNKFDKGNVALTRRITGVPKATISYWLKQPDSNTNLQSEKKLSDQTGETEPSNLNLNVDLDIDREIEEPSHHASIIERKLTFETPNKDTRLLEEIFGEQEIPVFDHEMLETVEKNVQKEGVSGKKTNQSILEVSSNLGNAEEGSHHPSIVESEPTLEDLEEINRLLEKILGEQEIPVFDHEMLETVEKNVQKEGVSGKKTNQSILEVSSNLGNAEEGSHHPSIVESEPTLEDLEEINRLLEKILGEQEIPVFDHEMLETVEKNVQKEGVSGKKTNQSILEVSSNLGNAKEGSHHPSIVESEPTLEDLEEINRSLEKILGEQEIPVFDHEMQSIVETNLQNEREIDEKGHMSKSFEKVDSNSRDNKEKNYPAPIVESSSIFDLLNQLEDAKETEPSFLEILNEQPAKNNSKQTEATINKKDNESHIFTVQEIQDKQEHSLLNLTENNRDKCSSSTRRTYVPLLPKQAIQNQVTILHFNGPILFFY
ncbi:hypothetical protein UAO_01213 [Enterococcus villorum ATCC 700913]|uniref:Uncharacterized protein n=3 Tax=Enterococcus villorum TaxID=112904 RepID=A0ABP2US74_9ENTE|nr:hypothetical protein [Enterococcus villorum]EOH89969.1 hypothetical protein UAO_01213 [Enterococcus villorum ATCC 700913]